MTSQSGDPRSPAGEHGAVPDRRRSTDIVRFAAGLVTATIILAGLYFGREILVPLAVAALIGFALNPLVTWLTRKGLPRVVSTSLVLLTVLLLVAGIALVLATQVRSLANDFPKYQQTMQRKVRDLSSSLSQPGPLDRARDAVRRLERQVQTANEQADDEPPPQKVEVVGNGATPLQVATTWLGRVGSPLVTLGIVFLFAFLMLLDVRDLRDRLLRLLGGDIHRTTDSMVDAGKRVSRYLLMQLTVNVTYAIPMGLGLWLIGVPGALLWATLAAVLRFVPYVGPLIGAALPLMLAFAVDDSWNMLLWAGGLILLLELISNNIVEPFLYGSSTGLSAISVIAAAMFWTALWGPMGLVLSTPLTVCLLVLGRNVPQLQFLNVLLGSAQALDLPSRLYQRLIAGDADEAIEIAAEEVEESSPLRFYNDQGIPLLRVACQDYRRHATAGHRLRFAKGMDSLIDTLRADHPPAAPWAKARPTVLCMGGKWDLDALSADMLAHALQLEGVSARALPAATATASHIARLDLQGVRVICLTYFTPNAALPARHLIRRLRLRDPDLQIVVAAWNAPEEFLKDESRDHLGATAMAASVEEAVARVQRLLKKTATTAPAPAPLEAEQARRAAVNAALLDPACHAQRDALCKRTADIFNAPIALLSTVGPDGESFAGQSGTLPRSVVDAYGMLRPLPAEQCLAVWRPREKDVLHVPDVAREPRLADHPLLQAIGARFLAAAPLHGEDDVVIGTLAILGHEPRTLSAEEQALLATLASEALVSGNGVRDQPDVDVESDADHSASLGQAVPE